jgi:hypothetical protein
MAIISEFSFPGLGELPRYTADVLRVEWEQGRDSYRRLDDVVETDVRAQRAIISWTGVLVAENADAQGVGAAALYEKIRSERAAGNDVNLEPDINARDSSNNRIILDIVTSGAPPEAYRTKQSLERLRRSFQVGSRNWFDPGSSKVASLNQLSNKEPLT